LAARLRVAGCRFALAGPGVTLLERVGVLTSATAARMRAMVRFRNAAVLQYQQLDQAILQAAVGRHLVDFEALCRQLAEA
jgi:uncharacterized protein YutE (UPF0331/DUF86 family)